MNLLVLPHVGGAYTSVRPEAETYIGLAKAGVNITMLANTERDFIDHFRNAGIKVIHFKAEKKISLSCIRLVRKTIDENDIQIVYATYSRNISNAAFACIGKKVKFIVYRGTTGGLYWYDPSSYLGVLHPRVDGVICVSHYVRKYVESRTRKRISNFVTAIYKGHDISWYTKQPVDLSSVGSNNKNFNVIAVINDRPHKGLIYLLKSAALLKDLENLHIILAGGNVSKPENLEVINESGMKDRIHILGYREDAPELIAASDVLVLPSLRKEGLPRVILEAQGYKIPVITSDNPGSMEIIENDVNGYVVPRKDHVAIAERIRYLHDNPEERQRLSSNSHAKLTGVFSHQLTVENTKRYFESLLV